MSPLLTARRTRTFVFVAVLFLACGFAWWFFHEPADPPFSTERYLFPQAPIKEVVTRPLAEIRDLLAPAELVLGVTIGQESRAYPLRLLGADAQRKVLNDTLAGQSIAATWCDACHNGIVYDRRVDGQTLTLAVSGQLWHNSMVMYDVETHSQWSQLRGEAMRGTLLGARLHVVPSMVTDWETWCRTQPDSTVAWFDGPSEELTRAVYDDPERFVLGIADDSKAKAWSFAELLRRGPRNDYWDGTPVVAVLEPPGQTARLYAREVEGRTLTFAREGESLIDTETRTTWEPITGKGVAGPLAGRSLVPLPAKVSLREAWRHFYPRSR